MSKPAQKCPKVSVLIPIYNVEAYLSQCLSSVCGQTLDDIEIICINDGSTDDSLEIIKDYMSKDKRIKLIDKANSGYGDSMNQGLELATGQYIGIVEPDDWIELNAFKELYKIAKDFDADIVRANYYHNRGGVDEKWRYIPMHETMYAFKPQEHLWLYLQAPAIWSAIYRREMLNKNNVRFLPTPGASYQDTGFNFKALAVAKKVVLTTNAYLHYRVDNESSSVKSSGKIFCIIDEYKSIEEFLREKQLFGELGIVMWNAKCFGYFWNTLRLDPDSQRKFLEKVADEYVRAAEEEVVFPDLVEGPIRAMTQQMMNNKVDEAIKTLQREQKHTKRCERRRRAMLKIFRTYAKQLEVEKLIQNLESQNEFLEQQVRDLRLKNEEQHD